MTVPSQAAPAGLVDAAPAPRASGVPELCFAPFMSDALGEIEVLTMDCQATGATPHHGDLLELGWAQCGPSGIVGEVRSFWIVPRSGRPVRRAVRELTGWTDACRAESVDESVAWDALCDDVARFSGTAKPAVPTVIHFARFEIPFLRDLHERLGGAGPFPFDAICLHALASRLFPDLPRRNIRALSGYLGHSPELLRRSAGHVEATAFIWRAVLPLLDAAGISTWQGLKAWLDEPAPAPRRARRVFPLAQDRRRSLPDRPGVYRFVRRNGDILYVGKATSLRKRVAGHFKSSGPVTERGLELLTQVHDVQYTETPSVLEAALLETDEIKRLEPPYNVQFRTAERSAWFCSDDFGDSAPAPDERHRIGPLPSRRALSPLSALIALTGEAVPSPAVAAAALAVPVAFGPEAALFEEGWRTFVSEHLGSTATDARRRVLGAALALWLARGRSEIEGATEEAEPNAWDLARVRRRLERNLVQAGLLVRRARLLCLLAGATVAFRERERIAARCFVLVNTRIVDRRQIENVAHDIELEPHAPGTLVERRRAFDAGSYDRLRVLLTELRRVLDEGGDVALRFGRHTFTGDRLRRLLRAV